MMRVYRKVMKAWHWIFDNGTRTVAVVNILLLYSWAASSSLAYYDESQTLYYQTFFDWAGYYWWALMIVLATVQTALLYYNSIRSRIISGFILLLSALIWGLISFKFTKAPIANTAISTYAVFALLCSAAGAVEMWVNDNLLNICAEGVSIKNSRYGARRKDGSTTKRDNSATISSNHILYDGRDARGVDIIKKGKGWLPPKHSIHSFWDKLFNDSK